MKLNHLLHQINPPCAKCPYELGQVQTLTNPCPQCKENGYRMYERFQQRVCSFDGESEQEGEQNAILP